MECEGGAEQVLLAGVTRFLNFERCPSKTKLATYLGEWEMLRRNHGDMIPDVFLYTMLLNMLPEDVGKETRDRRQTLNTTQRALDYLHGELARYSDGYLSKLHARLDAQHLAAGPSNSVSSVVEKQLQDMNNTFESLCAAFSKGKGKGTWDRKGAGKGDKGKGDGVSPNGLARPDPNWAEGACWHCGKQHPGGRRNCTIFKALIKKHGRLPKNYEGAYEKYQKEKGPHPNIASLQDAERDASDIVAAFQASAPDLVTKADVNNDEHAETPPFIFRFGGPRGSSGT